MIDFGLCSVTHPSETSTRIVYTIYRGDLVDGVDDATGGPRQKWSQDAFPLEQGYYDLQEVMTAEEAGEDLKAYAQHVAEVNGDVLRP